MLPYTANDMLKAIQRDYGIETERGRGIRASVSRPETRRLRTLLTGALLALRSAVLPG